MCPEPDIVSLMERSFPGGWDCTREYRAQRSHPHDGEDPIDYKSGCSWARRSSRGETSCSVAVIDTTSGFLSDQHIEVSANHHVKMFAAETPKDWPKAVSQALRYVDNLRHETEAFLRSQAKPPEIIGAQPSHVWASALEEAFACSVEVYGGWGRLLGISTTGSLFELYALFHREKLLPPRYGLSWVDIRTLEPGGSEYLHKASSLAGAQKYLVHLEHTLRTLREGPRV